MGDVHSVKNKNEMFHLI